MKKYATIEKANMNIVSEAIDAIFPSCFKFRNKVSMKIIAATIDFMA